MKAILQKAKSAPFRISLVLALPILASGCGSGSTPPTSSSGSLAGNWQMTMSPSDGNPEVKTESGFLLQNGDVVTGSVAVVDDPCSGIGSVTGTVTGTAVTLLVSPVGIQIDLNGSLGSDPTSMQGTYTIDTTGCASRQTAPQSGTWTANLVTPLNGSFSGTFTSTRFATTYTVSGQVSQGGNTGASNAPLSGNLSAPAGYCFTSVNITGVVSGTGVVMNLVDSTGAQVGQVTGASSLDGTSVTGKYSLIPQSTGDTCVAGDLGDVTFTL